MKFLSVRILFSGLLGLLFLNVQAQQSQLSGYHLLKKIEVGGEGGWDYLIAESNDHRLFVSHATKVIVIDTETDKIIGEISNLKGVHGIAIADEFRRGFISDGRDNSVAIFDLQTLKILDTVKVGKNPDAIIYDSGSKRVFVFNGSSSDSTVIDAVSGKVVATIALSGKPEFAASDGKGKVFVNIEDKSEIVEIDSRKLNVLAHWSITPGEEPSGMAIDRKNHLLFSVCSNKKMIVLNTENGKVVTELPTGDGSDAAAFDPETKLAFSSNGEGTLSVIEETSKDKFKVIENIQTLRGARTMAIDPRTHKIYLPTAQFGVTPAPTAEKPRPRPAIIPNSFTILVFGK